ncbi:MAG TPA: hypothetical protein VEK56_16265, partial [Vicinamibacterales bacterium]|nr:hypothetical protein [Vicinamibacterales bacterium]
MSSHEGAIATGSVAGDVRRGGEWDGNWTCYGSARDASGFGHPRWVASLERGGKVDKMETADRSVSTDLLLHSLFW